MAFPFAALIPVVGSLLDKLIPDPQERDKAKIKMLEMAQAGELAVLEAETKVNLAQIEVNKAEATTDMFRGGWRPATGWICVIGLGYNFLAVPILPWAVNVVNLSFGFNAVVPPLPSVGMEELMVLLMGMLGLGGLRTFEKIKQVA